MLRYKLLFRGELLENTDKDQCVKQLAKLFKKDPEFIISNMFKGKDVVVKNTDDREMVEKYDKAFTAAGARLIVKEVKTAEPGNKNEPDQKKPEDNQGKEPESQKVESGHKKSKRGWVFACLSLIVLLLIAIGGYWWLNTTVLKADIPQIVLESEDALAQEGLIALAHANVVKAVALEELFLGGPDEQAMKDSQNDKFLSRLLAANIEPRKTVRQALFALNLGGDLSAYYSVVILGQFDPERIGSFMAKEYETRPAKDNDRVTLFRKQNMDNCTYSPLRAAYVDQSRIVISAPETIGNLLKRLADKAPPEIDLGDWRQYRQNMLASAALFAPQHAQKAADGIFGMILQGIQREIGPVQSGFAGVSANIFPTGLKFEIVLNSTDQNWIDAKNQKLQQIFLKSKEKMPTGVPSLATLYDSIDFASTPGRLEAQLIVNKKLFDNFGKVAGEFMGSIFSPMDISAGFQQGQVESEQLDKSPIPYFDSYDASKLKPFDSIDDPNYKADWNDGPFGIFIENIQLNDNNEIEITLKAEGRQIENLGMDSERAGLTITSVKDVSGNELLKVEKCGTKRNDLPVFFKSFMQGSFYKDGKFVHYRKTNAEKSFRLQPGIKVDEVTSLNGVIALDLPIQTEKVLLTSPFGNQILQRDDVRFQFQESSADQLRYNLSGDKKNVLTVRGLNKDKKLLAKSYGSSMGRLFGTGKSYSQNYQGKVEYAEIVLAKKSEQLQYPFTLSSIMPSQAAGSIRVSELIIPYSLSSFDEMYALAKAPEIGEEVGWLGNPDDKQSTGPFLWELYRFQVGTHWGTTGTFKIYSPIIPTLSQNLSAIELALDEAVTPDEKSIPFTFKNYIALKRVGGYYMNGVYKPDPKKNYLEGQGEISVDYKGEKPSKINGKLIMRLPVELSRVELKAVALGQEIVDAGYKLKVTGMMRNRVHMIIDGDRGRIVAFNVYNSDNQSIKGNQASLSMTESGLLAELNFNGTPAGVTMHIAKQIESREFPIQIDIPEGQ